MKQDFLKTVQAEGRLLLGGLLQSKGASLYNKSVIDL